MGLYDTVAGAFDHAAGSVDESIGRQFDDTEGGGFIDETAAVLDPTRRASENTEEDLGTVGETVGSSAAAVIPGAHLLSPFIGQASQGDELVGRTLDDEPGGGIQDLWNQATPDVPSLPDVPDPTDGGTPWLLLAVLAGGAALLAGGVEA